MKHELNGWLLVDKPVGISSNQLLGKLKYKFRPKKIGFVGTLDPLASGLLPVALGEATKTIQYVEEVDKIYEFSIIWGEHRESFDAEGRVEASSEVRPTSLQLSQAVERFKGQIEQVPPKYSAIKINGKRAYDLARREIDFEIKSRKIEIFELEYLPELGNCDESFFRVHCSKGTYVRSLAVDIARECGALGYVKHLRRVKSGPFEIKNTILLDFLENMVQNVEDVLLPVETALGDIPVYAVTEEEVRQLRFGLLLEFDSSKAEHEGEVYKAFYKDHLIALLEWDKGEGRLRSKRVFNLYSE